MFTHKSSLVATLNKFSAQWTHDLWLVLWSIDGRVVESNLNLVSWHLNTVGWVILITGRLKRNIQKAPQYNNVYVKNFMF